MFGKKKREAEARALAEEQARQKAVKKGPTASWRKVGGLTPVAKPADHIQLTPIVQPIPLVPYSTQMQPLAMYEDDFEEDYE